MNYISIKLYVELSTLRMCQSHLRLSNYHSPYSALIPFLASMSNLYLQIPILTNGWTYVHRHVFAWTCFLIPVIFYVRCSCSLEKIYCILDFNGFSFNSTSHVKLYVYTWGCKSWLKLGLKNFGCWRQSHSFWWLEIQNENIWRPGMNSPLLELLQNWGDKWWV